MNMKFLIWLFWCVSSGCYAEELIKGIVTNVIDGNTIEISSEDNQTYQVMLHGIDSPEPGQNYSEQAQRLLSKLLFKKTVTVMIRGKNRLGIRLGEIQISGAPDPRHELIKEGLAWTAEREPIAELESLKEQARLEGRGLWKEENPTPPWIFRRQQSMMQPKTSS